MSGADAHGRARLADRLERSGPAIADQAVARMYDEDPFWTGRFGARGRRYADEDGRHHLAYLVESLRLGTPRSLVEYARWLRGVLVTRGMCTRHLADHLARFGAMVQEAEGDAAPAGEFLRAAIDGLAYDAEPARTLLREADALGDAAARASGAPAHEARHLATYVADAVASGSAEMLARYLEWLRGSLDERVGAGRGDALCDALGDALARAVDVLPSEARTAAQGRLREARTAEVRAGG